MTGPEPSEPPETTDPDADAGKQVRDLNVVGQIVFAVLAAWVALVAIPGALPWASADDSQRVVFVGLAISTIVALVGLAVAWTQDGETAQEGGRIGVWASRLGIALAALGVVMALLVPADYEYRSVALGIGLLVILAAALLATLKPSGGDNVLTGLRLSNLSVVSSIAAVVLIGGYYLAVNALFPLVPSASDAQWVKYTDLVNGLEALAFAAAGALLGNAVQRQVTNHVEGQLAASDETTDALNGIVDDTVKKAQTGEIVEVAPLVADDGAFATALRESNVEYLQDPVRRAQRLAEIKTAVATPASAFADEIRARQKQANSHRARR